MPTVPRYDSLQVADRVLPAARQESVASPALFATQGENAVQLGKGLAAGGTALTEVAGKIQDRENVDLVLRAETAFKDELLRFDTDQRSKKGAAALADGGITQQTEDWFAKTAPKVADTLTNAQQKRLFAQTTEKLRIQTLHTHSLHQAEESRQSVVDSSTASIVGSINRAAANANDWTISEAEAGEIRRRVAAVAKVNGYTLEQAETMTGQKLTELHKQVIQQLVTTNPAAAKAYYDKYEKEIDGQQRAEIGEFAKKATATSLGDGAADSIWKADSPKTRTDPVNLASMEEKLRTQLKGNDDAIEKGIKGLRERAQAYKDQRKEESNALEAGVNSLILGGASAAQLRRSPEYLKLSAQDPEAARKIDTYMENKEYMRIARAAASEQRADAAEARTERRLHRSTLDTTLRYSDPAVLAASTRDEIVNLLPVLGATSTTALLAKYDSISKSEDKLREAKIDKQDFDRIALSAGYRPNEPHKSEEEKDRLVRLQSQVETAIDIEQRRLKRGLTREETTKVMQREIDNSVMVYQFFGSNKSRPAGALSPSEQENAYVEVGKEAKRVYMKEIPPTFRMEAMRSRAAQGLPTTEKQLGELWLRGQGKLK